MRQFRAVRANIKNEFFETQTLKKQIEFFLLRRRLKEGLINNSFG